MSQAQLAVSTTQWAMSRELELMTTIIRTADALKRHFQALIDHEQLTLPQFNVLRILRRAGPDGLPTLTIRDRMVERAPAITRLVDKLVDRGLVVRQRDAEDRRVVYCRVTEPGMELLERLDPVLDEDGPRALAALNGREQHTVLRALERLLDTLES